MNRVVVDPGEVTTPHTHGGQEVFVAATDGQIGLDGEVHEVPAGGVVRVAPETVSGPTPSPTGEAAAGQFAVYAP